MSRGRRQRAGTRHAHQAIEFNFVSRLSNRLQCPRSAPILKCSDLFNIRIEDVRTQITCLALEAVRDFNCLDGLFPSSYRQQRAEAAAAAAASSPFFDKQTSDFGDQKEEPSDCTEPGPDCSRGDCVICADPNPNLNTVKVHGLALFFLNIYKSIFLFRRRVRLNSFFFSSLFLSLSTKRDPASHLLSLFVPCRRRSSNLPLYHPFCKVDFLIRPSLCALFVSLARRHAGFVELLV